LRIVIDGNVVVAAARTPGVCRAVLVRAVADHDIVLSRPIVAEYREVGRRPKYRRYRDTMDTVTDLLERVAIAVEPDHPPFGLPDPDDEIDLATAVTGGFSTHPSPPAPTPATSCGSRICKTGLAAWAIICHN
jgi:uncharacterized protein